MAYGSCRSCGCGLRRPAWPACRLHAAACIRHGAQRLASDAPSGSPRLPLPQAAAADARAAAAAAIEGSDRVRAALGGDVRVLAPVAQSSAACSVDGASRTRVSLLLPVAGAGGGAAQARVEYVVGGEAGAAPQLVVEVALRNGSTIRLGGPGRGQRVIPVKWRDVDR